MNIYSIIAPSSAETVLRRIQSIRLSDFCNFSRQLTQGDRLGDKTILNI